MDKFDRTLIVCFYTMILVVLLVFVFGVFQSAECATLSEISSKYPNQPLIIADKASGTLSIYRPENKSIISNPALFGQEIEDNLSMSSFDIGTSRKVTPAGTFIAEKAYSSKMHEPIIIFIHGKKQLLAIHPIYLGKPNERRIERIQSLSSEDNRISNGCINVLVDFFNVLYSLPNKTPIVILSEADKLVVDVSESQLFEVEAPPTPINRRSVAPKIPTQYGELQ